MGTGTKGSGKANLVDRAQDSSPRGSWRKFFGEGGLIIEIWGLVCKFMGQGGGTGDNVIRLIGPDKMV